MTFYSLTRSADAKAYLRLIIIVLLSLAVYYELYILVPSVTLALPYGNLWFIICCSKFLYVYQDATVWTSKFVQWKPPGGNPPWWVSTSKSGNPPVSSGGFPLFEVETPQYQVGGFHFLRWKPTMGGFHRGVSTGQTCWSIRYILLGLLGFI